MKAHFYLLIAALVFIGINSCESPDNPSIILRDATIIDIRDGQLTTTSLLIEDSLIKEIGNFSLLAKGNPAQVIDCKGKYMIPGLIDVHTHISEHKNPIPKLDRFLLNGITGIRDMGGVVDTVTYAKDLIVNGNIKGPNIYYAGVTLDGPQSNDPFHIKIHDTTDLKELALGLKNKGIHFFKVHNYFPKDRLLELKELSNEFGLKIAGHIPVTIGPMELEFYGIDCVEHMNSLISGLVLKESNGIEDITTALTTLDSTYVSKLSRYYVENNIAITPTLYTLEDMYSHLENEASRATGMRMMAHFYEITRWMNQNDVVLLSGSDMGPINDTTLDGLHKELEMMVKSGLSPLDALKTATINPSQYLNIDNEYGSIEANKKADLVILNSNPLENISNTRDIHIVIKDGELFRES
ncbi:amidohydrolase family protein [Aureisphaera galaxeae]|uniref:amidohydrolase family protein n=1 Tax=Aureisphaera galaxeae TaxID=1538023 RepID=UPI002350D6CE|nr:amidohydrolase family protein [Aureisphaera galaxeae]MDC8002529.1 amidohydrolase family protein [Aureisphaera galaxeae]